MRSLFGPIAMTLVLTLARPAAAQDESTRAKDLFEQGMARFQLEEFDDAITFWQDGFRVRPVPEFLYNIAQAYRLSRRSEKALAFYQKYLQMSPKAKNRVEVERHIATLTKVLEQEQRAVSAPPMQPLSEIKTPSKPKPAVAATEPPRAVEPPTSEPPKSEPPKSESPTVATPVHPEPTQPQTTVKQAPRAVVYASTGKPVYKKGWFWGVVGGGVAVVVVAVVIGVVVSGGGGDSTRALPDLRF